MKIAYCIPGLHNPSGMERVLTLKANYLSAQGVDVHIILTDGKGKKRAFPLDERITVHQLDIDFEEPYRYTFIKRTLLYYRKMNQLEHRLNECLNQIKPDITVSLLRRDINVMHKMTDGSIKIGEIHFDRLHYRQFHSPRWLPSCLHTAIERRWMQSLIRKLQKLSAFVVLTHEDAQNWPELNNITVIPNPTSFFPEKTSTCTNKQAIAAGRYTSQKGFDRLIAAWKQVATKHPDWILTIYGDGALREQLSAQISKSGLQNCCHLKHSVKDISTKLQESSIFILSSRYEGLPMILLEAMACGLPAVAFTCPCGPRDIISNSKDGILANDGNIDELANGINQLIENEELRQAMGKQARTRAEQFSIERIGIMWLDLFKNCIDKHTKQPDNE